MGAVRFHVGRLTTLVLLFIGLIAAEPACAGLRSHDGRQHADSWLLGIGTVIASIALWWPLRNHDPEKAGDRGVSAPIIGMIAFGSIADLIGLLM